MRRHSTADYRGKTYARAFDLMVRAYEGGYHKALSAIFRANPERGPAYVRDVFERSERPPICPVSPSIFRESGDTTWVFDDESKSWVVWDPPPECGGGGA